MPDVRISDIDCYYEIRGSGGPLVLIAGLASDSQSWLPVLDRLAEDFKVIIFDNRGIGRTRYPRESFTISTLAHDTVSLLDKLGIEKADILGHSMGGYIAQEIAIAYPERVNKLVLASTCAVPSQKDISALYGLLKILEDGNGYEPFIRGFLNLIFSPAHLGNKDNMESAVRHAVDYPYPITAEGFRLQLEAISRFDSRERLGGIKAGTLVMAGGKDALITEGEIRLLADNIASAEMSRLENSGHAIQVEEPGIFAGRVKYFLLNVRNLI